MATAAPVRPWSTLTSQLTPERRRVVGLAAILLAGTLLPLAGPQLISRFVDDAIAQAPTSRLAAIAIAYLVVAVGAQVCAVAVSYLGSGLSWRTTNRLREQLVEHALDLDMAFHGRHTAGEMIERVDGDVVKLTEFISGFVMQAISSGLLLAGTLVLVFAANLLVGAVLTAMVLTGGVVLARAQQRVLPQATALREETAQLFGNLEERLAGAEDIRANGAGRHVVNRFHEASARVYRADVAWQVSGGLVLAGTNLLFGIGTIVVVALGIVLLDRGAVTVGTVVLLFQYAQMVRRPVEQIVFQAKDLQQAGASVNRVAELLAEQPSVVFAQPGRPLPPTGPLGVRLAGVTFAYPGVERRVLDDVDLAIPAGRSVGVVGRTGSGKSTLARLLLRLYDPTGGRAELRGVDLREVSQPDLRRQVGMVTQEVQLFGATVRETVTLFDDEIADETVAAVLDEVGLTHWVAELPDGLSTQLGAAGTGLSEGEAQLLALARVFLADPGLVVLDEPSSRLDPATDALITRATDRLLAGRTGFVIAHRMSSLARVDDIVVVEHGRIVEHGPRAELAADPTSRYAGMLGATR